MKTIKNRRLIMMSLFALLLIGALLLGARLTPALADASYPNQDDLVETDEPRLIDDMATQTAEQPDTEKEAEDQGSPATPNSAALLQSMMQDFENATFSRSGWLHYVYYLESDVPNGVTLPQNYFCDGWFLIDETGNVTQHVISYYDDAGNLNQREIFKDNTLINVTTNDKMETEGPYRLKLDLGVARYMLEMQAEGSILTHEVSTIDEKPMTQFSVTGNYEDPAVFGNVSQPVESARVTLLFDQATGAISEMEYGYILVDGTEELFYNVQASTLEWDDLPQEFVSLLK